MKLTDQLFLVTKKGKFYQKVYILKDAVTLLHNTGYTSLALFWTASKLRGVVLGLNCDLLMVIQPELEIYQIPFTSCKNLIIS
jgi:hypothetical protein